MFDILDYPLSYFLLSKIIKGHYLFAEKFLYLCLPVLLLKMLNVSCVQFLILLFSHSIAFLWKCVFSHFSEGVLREEGEEKL